MAVELGVFQVAPAGLELCMNLYQATLERLRRESVQEPRLSLVLND